MNTISVNGKIVQGSFSDTAKNVRRIWAEDGKFLGTITKVEGGYRVRRTDGKTRTKPNLQASFKAVARAN